MIGPGCDLRSFSRLPAKSFTLFDKSRGQVEKGIVSLCDPHGAYDCKGSVDLPLPAGRFPFWLDYKSRDLSKNHHSNMKKTLDSNFFAAWFLMGAMIIAFLVATGEAMGLHLEKRFNGQSDLVIYTEKDLRPLVKQEWRAFKREYKVDKQMALRTLDHENLADLVSSSKTIVIRSQDVEPAAQSIAEPVAPFVQEEILAGNRSQGIQSLVIISNGRTPEFAKSLVAFMKSDEGQAIASRKRKKGRNLPS